MSSYLDLKRKVNSSSEMASNLINYSSLLVNAFLDKKIVVGDSLLHSVLFNHNTLSHSLSELEKIVFAVVSGGKGLFNSSDIAFSKIADVDLARYNTHLGTIKEVLQLNLSDKNDLSEETRILSMKVLDLPDIKTTLRFDGGSQEQELLKKSTILDLQIEKDILETLHKNYNTEGLDLLKRIDNRFLSEMVAKSYLLNKLETFSYQKPFYLRKRKSADNPYSVYRNFGSLSVVKSGAIASLIEKIVQYLASLHLIKNENDSELKKTNRYMRYLEFEFISLESERFYWCLKELEGANFDDSVDDVAIDYFKEVIENALSYVRSMDVILNNVESKLDGMKKPDKLDAEKTHDGIKLLSSLEFDKYKMRTENAWLLDIVDVGNIHHLFMRLKLWLSTVSVELTHADFADFNYAFHNSKELCTVDTDSHLAHFLVLTMLYDAFEGYRKERFNKVIESLE